MRLATGVRRAIAASIVVLALGSCGGGSGSGSGGYRVPALDHVIVVVLENKSYAEARVPPYTASLVGRSASFSGYRAIAHPSQPNYLALWSGSTQGVVSDSCPAPGSPYSAPNLGQACEAAGITWRAYSEDLPSVGSSACDASDELCTRRHAPWTYFSNLNHGNERPYADLAADIRAGTLPRLAFVIPNNCNNAHGCSIQESDGWLSRNVPAMLAAVGRNGIVVLTWDEDDNEAGNHILTVIAGMPVRTGYVSSRATNHYALLRTLCDALRIAPLGLASREAPITDIWAEPAQAPALVTAPRK